MPVHFPNGRATALESRKRSQETVQSGAPAICHGSFFFFFYPRDGAKGPTSHGTAPTLTANATNGSPVVLANPDANHGAGIFTYMTG